KRKKDLCRKKQMEYKQLEDAMDKMVRGITTFKGASKFLNIPLTSLSKNVDTHNPARQYRGVRMRRWGKWVSEIRDPITRSRIWLGSFRSAEEAAHAYDAAVVCIRGPNSQPNFPHHNPTIPSGTPGRYSRHEIQAAAVASAAACVGRPFNYSEFLSPTSTTSDSGDEEEEEEEEAEEEELEDITYTGPSWSHQAAES
ncbi:unnamed protein product, partial [Sphagnum troendelagicum]